MVPDPPPPSVAWQSGSTYLAGSAVIYNGVNYVTTGGVTSSTVNPATDTADWQLDPPGTPGNIVAEASTAGVFLQINGDAQLGTVSAQDAAGTTFGDVVIDSSGALLTTTATGSTDATSPVEQTVNNNNEQFLLTGSSQQNSPSAWHSGTSYAADAAVLYAGFAYYTPGGVTNSTATPRTTSPTGAWPRWRR